MLHRYGWRVAVLSVLALGLTTPAWAADKTTKDLPTFGTLSSPSDASVRMQAFKWLKDVGKSDDATRKSFDALWSSKDKPLLDKLTATFELGNPQAREMLRQAREAVVAPTSLPALLKDAKQPLFVRSNLALAYAKALSGRKVYEEALETLKLFKADQVVDPSSFLFYQAVAEHALMQKKEANETIVRLLDDVPTAPERYRMVATLMHFDMVTWTEQSISDKLASIGRKMDNVGRRLDLARGGKETQKQQKDIVRRLDELIKELENANKGGS
jgi:tetratricopeptide (TPR) repeat protein